MQAIRPKGVVQVFNRQVALTVEEQDPVGLTGPPGQVVQVYFVLSARPVRVDETYVSEPLPWA